MDDILHSDSNKFTTFSGITQVLGIPKHNHSLLVFAALAPVHPDPLSPQLQTKFLTPSHCWNRPPYLSMFALFHSKKEARHYSWGIFWLSRYHKKDLKRQRFKSHGPNRGANEPEGQPWQACGIEGFLIPAAPMLVHFWLPAPNWCHHSQSLGRAGCCIFSVLVTPYLPS